LTSQETQSGSLTRAIKAFEKSDKSDFGIGIEVSYEKNNEGNFEIFCWTSIVNDSLRVSVPSHTFVLPKFHQKILGKGLYLGDYVREYIINNSNPINLQIGKDIRERKPFITNAVRNCLLRFLEKK